MLRRSSMYHQVFIACVRKYSLRIDTSDSNMVTMNTPTTITTTTTTSTLPEVTAPHDTETTGGLKIDVIITTS
jgi:SET domain-containing protein